LGNSRPLTNCDRRQQICGADFEQLFWCEDTGFYAYALDGDKKQVKTIISNAGHLLWSGIVSGEHAAHVVARLLRPDMWSGWGIRTLSSDNRLQLLFSSKRFCLAA
jgi:glycogen debranching enzyme